MIASKTFSSGLLIIRKRGVTDEQPRAARDDFLKKAASKSQVPQTVIPTTKLQAKIIPRKVATPLPPLNLK